MESDSLIREIDDEVKLHHSSDELASQRSILPLDQELRGRGNREDRGGEGQKRKEKRKRKKKNRKRKEKK